MRKRGGKRRKRERERKKEFKRMSMTKEASSVRGKREIGKRNLPGGKRRKRII